MGFLGGHIHLNDEKSIHTMLERNLSDVVK